MSKKLKVLVFAPVILVLHVVVRWLRLGDAIVLGSLALWVIVQIVALLYGSMYRPRENHVGIIYSRKRFARFADPDSYQLVLPWWEEVVNEIPLKVRVAIVELQDILTEEQVPVNVTLEIEYRVDLRRAANHFDKELCHLDERQWTAIVRKHAHDIAVNEVIGTQKYAQWLSEEGHALMRNKIAFQLEQRLWPLGISLNGQHCLSIQYRPNKTVEAALQKLSAASLNGEASVDQLAPVLRELRQRFPTMGQELFFTMMAIKAYESEDPSTYFDVMGRSMPTPLMWMGNNHPPRADGPPGPDTGEPIA